MSNRIRMKGIINLLARAGLTLGPFGMMHGMVSGMVHWKAHVTSVVGSTTTTSSATPSAEYWHARHGGARTKRRSIAHVSLAHLRRLHGLDFYLLKSKGIVHICRTIKNGVSSSREHISIEFVSQCFYREQISK